MFVIVYYMYCFNVHVGVTIHVNDAEAEADTSSSHVDENEVDGLVKKIPSLDKLKDLKVVPLEFEKV